MHRLMALVIPVLVAPLLAHAQSAPPPGVRFEQGLSWPGARAKAKAADKHIFMVLFTTSCEPCTAMDRQVYTQEQLGVYLNDKFMAIRVQLDTTPHDGVEVRRWYAEARKIRRRYAVTQFPTFLFFSPAGELVHGAAGEHSAAALQAVAAAALDPAKQYYTRLARYQRGRKEFAALPEMVRIAKSLGDTATARRLADDYVAHLRGPELYAKANLEFLGGVTLRSTDRGFALFQREGAKVDSVLGQAGAAQGVVDRIITNEEIRPSLAAAAQGGSPPDWPRIAARITQQYGAKAAERTVLRSKVGWYQSHQDWPNYIEHLILRTEKYDLSKDIGIGFLAAMGLNNAAWDVFLHSNDQAALTKALAWSDRAVRADPTAAAHVDTYANLLYKLGRAEEAMLWEEVALKLQPNNQEFVHTLEKMKKGEPTWPQP